MPDSEQSWIEKYRSALDAAQHKQSRSTALLKALKGFIGSLARTRRATSKQETRCQPQAGTATQHQPTIATQEFTKARDSHENESSQRKSPQQNIKNKRAS